jgi:hypothetical protein
MVKFTATGQDGRRLLGIGLSAENVRRLRAGKPIHFSALGMGLGDFDVVITYGETEADIARELAPAIGPRTKRTLEGQ